MSKKFEVSVIKTRIGNLEAKAFSDLDFDGTLLDTKIEISGGVLCWVEGAKRDEFFKEINSVIKFYQI